MRLSKGSQSKMNISILLQNNIKQHANYKIQFYYCKLHPDIQNAYLETIEHHCKYKKPDRHKAEILRLMRQSSTYELTKERANDPVQNQKRRTKFRAHHRVSQ
jgi:hypothetical protein